MIREEFKYEDMKQYLFNNIDVLITGMPRTEERSQFFYNELKECNKIIILLDLTNDNNLVASIINSNKDDDFEGDISNLLPCILMRYNINNSKVLVELTSLHHVVLMVLIKILIKEVKPISFFASYIRPKKYNVSGDETTEVLTTRISEVKSIPKFTRRLREDPMLCSFIGFEGFRYKNILESIDGIRRTRVITAFPSGKPHWFNTTMWNAMDELLDDTVDNTVHKCFSESIFEAVSLLKEFLLKEKNIILAPIGTRPHAAACAIFGCINANVNIVYDYATESENRTEGIDEIIIYHLSSFIEMI